MAITELKPYLSNIADKLKSLLGITDKINAQDFVEKIDEVYEQGKKSQYDEFWDDFQNNGKRSLYENAFAGRDNDYTLNGIGGGWSDKTFKPKYDMQPINAYYMFYRNVRITNIVDCGVKIDFSKSKEVTGVFYGCSVKELGVISVVSATSSLSNLFGYCTKLITIEKLILKEDGSNNFAASTFDYCGELKNIVIEGKIGNSVNLSRSPKLTYESLISIINALKDYSGTTSTYTLTLHANAKAKLTEVDIATITQKGWTLA